MSTTSITQAVRCTFKGAASRSNRQLLGVGGTWRGKPVLAGGIPHAERSVAAYFKTDTASDVASDLVAADGEGVTDWEIRLLYDGDCSLCMREVAMLRERDGGKGKIQFVDISAPDYLPEDNAGVTYEVAMGNIHGILPDGSVVTSIEVFRRCYEAVGLGWVYAATKYEPVRKAAEAVYGVWAKYRLPLTGRGDLQVVLEKRRDQIDEIGCGEEAEACELPWADDDGMQN